MAQSFGGFCSPHPISPLFPDSLHEVYLTGGVAPIGRSADEVYRATYQRVADKNRAFFARFPCPGHRQPAGDHLHRHDVRLPNSQRLTVEQLQQQGLDLGASGDFEELYCLLEDAFIGERTQPRLPLQGAGHAAVQHQSCVRHLARDPSIARERQQLGSRSRSGAVSSPGLEAQGKDFAFTGEMIFPGCSSSSVS